MPDRRISVRQRVRSIDYLEWQARQLNKAASWLAEQGFEDEADILNGAAKDAMAVVGMLARPLLPRGGPEEWQQPQPPR